MHYRYYGFLAFFILFCTWSGPAPAAGTAQEKPQQIEKGTRQEEIQQQLEAVGALKKERTKAQKKMSSGLLHAVEARKGIYRQQGLAGLKPQLEVGRDNTVLLDIKGKVTPELLDRIEVLGGTIVNAFAQYDAIRARLPIDQVENLAEEEDVRHLGPAEQFLLNKINTSEGDIAHSVATVRKQKSVTGKGIKVGVISDSVDYLKTVQASGDLPGVTVLSNSPGYSGEGTAMLEIIHDLAPGAELYFATAVGGRAAFAAGIISLANAGCRIIVDDIGYLEESPFQDDVVSQAVNTVTAGGVLYFSAAGNGGNRNDGTSGVWEGDYRAVPITDPNYESVNNFGGGYRNRITVGTPACYTLFWADPLGGSANDYDLFLADSGGNIVAVSDGPQDGDDDPIEAICPEDWGISDTTGYNLMVAKFSGAVRYLHLNTNHGGLQYGTAGQIKGHQAAAESFAVAAVSAKGRTRAFSGAESVQRYSSDGPRRIFFKPDGSAVTPGNYSAGGGMLRYKPDIAAADGVKTATPGSYFNPFYGTSASAPHAAAIAALMLNVNPQLTSDLLRQVFSETALDIESSGWDRDSGFGIVMADRIFAAQDLWRLRVITPIYQLLLNRN